MKDELDFICKDFRVKARQVIEKHRLLETLVIGSSEYNIQLEVFNNIMEELNKYAEVIYTTILSYNHAPDTFTKITRNDVLQYQLVQDEVTSFLKENGIFLNYVHPKDKKNDA